MMITDNIQREHVAHCVESPVDACWTHLGTPTDIEWSRLRVDTILVHAEQ